MPRERLKDGFTTVDAGDNNRWAYTKEFNDLKHEKPDALNLALKLMKELKTEGQTAEEQDIKVMLVGKKEAEPRTKDTVHYYKLDVLIEGITHSFFIKRTPIAYKKYGGGYSEAVSSHKAVELLKEKNIKNVQIVDFQFGYDDEENWYFVSKWNEALQHPMDQYIENLDRYIKENPIGSDSQRLELEQLIERVKNIRTALVNYSDIAAYNMYYNPEADEVTILFDLFEGPLETQKVD